MANDAVVDVGPVFYQRREEVLEFKNRIPRLLQSLLELRKVRHRLLDASRHSRHLQFDVLLQDDGTVVQGSDKSLNGLKEVFERSVAHEDDILLWGGCASVVRIPLIFWKEIEEMNVQVL